MRTKLQFAALALLLSTINHPISTAFGQGSLSPAGAPAPTMKSLAQIEPRTPISSAPFTITQPGSYYLTTNISVSTGNAISVTTSGVTLDLGGWTITSSSPTANGYGIELNTGFRDIAIFNGHIRGGVTNNGSGVYNGSGFLGGIGYNATGPANTLVSGVTVSGCRFTAIDLGSGDATVVESCTVRTAGNYGIVASTIKSSEAVDCGSFAISGDQVSDCRGASSNSIGIYATSTAQNCSGFSGSSQGLNATTALNCFGSSAGAGDGLSANTALNCYGSSSSGNGLSANIAQNCYGTSTSGDGLHAYSLAQNCYGNSMGGGNGLFAFDIAIGCRGTSTSGTGLSAFLANSCRGASTSGTALSTSHNVNSF